jgi:hypothetical protein
VRLSVSPHAPHTRARENGEEERGDELSMHGGVITINGHSIYLSVTTFFSPPFPLTDKETIITLSDYKIVVISSVRQRKSSSFCCDVCCTNELLSISCGSFESAVCQQDMHLVLDNHQAARQTNASLPFLCL